MANVFGPFFSVDAKGTVAKTLTAQGRPGGTAIIKPPRASKKSLEQPSLAKCNQRGIMALLIAHWQTMPQSERDTWNTNAKTSGKQIAGYHYFIQEAQKNLFLHHGLAGYWAMNEATGEEVKDLSGNGNHGILKPTYPSNVPQRVKSMVPNFGNALEMKGWRNHVDCGHTPSLNITTPMTAELWFQPSAVPVNGGVMAKYSPAIGQSGYGGFDWWLRTSYLIQWSVRGGDAGKKSTGQVQLTPGEWVYLVGIASEEETACYLNGEKVMSTSGILPAPTLDSLRIGGRGSAVIPGRYDEARIYHRAKPAAEIYNNWRMLR